MVYYSDGVCDVLGYVSCPLDGDSKRPIEYFNYGMEHGCVDIEYVWNKDASVFKVKRWSAQVLEKFF
jgi:hypothetical protein